MALDTENGGFAAAALLDRMMNGQKAGNQEIVVNPSHVYTRQTTDITAVDDPEVVKAICFIRTNARERISVIEVVGSTSLSRRGLETRFGRAVGRSIHREIRRRRVELIEQLLIETSMPIAEIISRYNFSDAEHIARYFRKEKGIGLREFRRLHSAP